MVPITAQTLAEHRRQKWPNSNALPVHLAEIYSSVKSTGVPNALQAKITLPSSLNLDEWDAMLGENSKYDELRSFLRYGFPMGYMGPISNYDEKYNHSSATNFSEHVDGFIEKELSLGGILGPMSKKPFEPWLHSAPLMTRPKRDSDARRIIADLTFPEEVSVNSYILKNAVWGQTRQHCLPTVHEFIDRLRETGRNAYMSTVDISRAYKNLHSDPLDWPLLCASWQDQYYCDITVLFGARASSMHMQSVANAIVDILSRNGIEARMYLDDLITLAPTKEKAERDHRFVRELLKKLGLPEACEKAQTPSRAVEWLGILINSADMSLSIPQKKVKETLVIVRKYSKKQNISKKDLQSVIGRLIHVAKCVGPARLFVSRLLDALREMHGTHTEVTNDMRCDFEWFSEFCNDWNGVSIIPKAAPNKEIVVDASLTGIGASDGSRAYASQICDDSQIARSISELEAINIGVALHSFVDQSWAGSHIRVLCDNLPSVTIMQTGKGRNKVILEVARAIWMLQAKFNIDISYDHIKGELNTLADALSRAHLSPKAELLANKLIHDNQLEVISPCLYIFSTLNHNAFL